MSSRLARPLVRAFARRLASSVGASHAENRSARTMWPPGASTRTHSVARDLVRPLIERGGDQHQVEGSIGKGSRSATPPRRRAVHRPWTLQPHRSCPAPDRSPRARERPGSGSPLPGAGSRTATHVQDPAGSRMRRHRKRRHPLGELTVKPPEPTLLVAGNSPLEGGDVSLLRHDRPEAGPVPAHGPVATRPWRNDALAAVLRTRNSELPAALRRSARRRVSPRVSREAVISRDARWLGRPDFGPTGRWGDG